MTVNVQKIKFDPGKSVPVELKQVAEHISVKILSSDNGYHINDFEKVFLIDSLIIVPQKERGEILMFDLNGKPKRKLRLMGSGAGKILDMSDVFLNKTTKVLEVLDKKVTKVFSYDLKGKFIKEVRLNDFKFTGFRFVSNSEFYVFERIRTRSNNDRLGVFDKDFKYINSYLKIPDPIAGMNYLRQHILEVYKDSVYYIPLLENKIYNVTKKGAQPVYEFDAPDAYKVTDNFMAKNKFTNLGQFLLEMETSKLIICTDHLYITDDFIYFSYRTEKGWKKLLYSKHTQKVVEHTYLKLDNAASLELTAPVIGTDGDNFAYLIHQSNNPNLPDNIKEKLTVNSNPVLLYFKFKKF
ncbi:6-bladed beta-propeller [Pedobacter sp. UYP24]